MTSPDDDFLFGEPPKHLGRSRLPRIEYIALMVGLAIVASLLMIWRVSSQAEPTPSLPPSLPAVAANPSLDPSVGPSLGPSGQQPPPREDELAPQLQKILDLGMPVYCGGGTQPMVALTFDDGPGAYTPYALDTLRSYDARSTFFLVGKLFGSKTNQRVSREEGRFGDIGNHSWSHFGLAGEPRYVLDREVKRTKKIIERYSGTEVIYFRPPWGSRDRALDEYVKALGMIEVMWTFDTYDSRGAKTDEIIQTVLRHARPGSIILMHENRGTTKNALQGILSGLVQKNLKPVTLTTLLTEDPPTRGQLKKGLQGCR